MEKSLFNSKFNNKFFLVHIFCPNFSTMHWVCVKGRPVSRMDGESKDKSMVLIQANSSVNNQLSSQRLFIWCIGC